MDASPPTPDRFALFAVGQTATTTRTVLDMDVVLFAAITGDANPVHLDAEAGTRAGFGGRIAHGALTVGFVSATMGMHLPGPGAVYLSQSVRFLRPVRIGDEVTTKVAIVEVKPEKRELRLSTECRNQAGKRVLDGEAVVLVPKVA
jgi:3-hydroxybutyryl-CoA dehydratase